MDQNLFELYADYLLCSFNQTTATGLSSMLDGAYSHDKVTRLLSQNDFSSKTLWSLVKHTVREIEHDDGVLIFDDTVQAKPFSDEDELISWHFDHNEGRSVKGINLLNCVYSVNNITIPVGYELIKKPSLYCDIKTRKEKRKALKTKNEYFRTLLATCCKNSIKFRNVLADSWFSSKENMMFVRHDCNKDFIFAMKSNRLVWLTPPEIKSHAPIRLDALKFEKDKPLKVWISGVDFPVLVHRRIFKNKDGSEGILYLACSDLTCDAANIEAAYHKRWSVEVFHKVLKSNAGLAKSPASAVQTQSNHIFMSIYAAFKLACLSVKKRMNPFALKAKLYLKALQASFQELNQMMKVSA